jgi:hypothetical protein
MENKLPDVTYVPAILSGIHAGAVLAASVPRS